MEARELVRRLQRDHRQDVNRRARRCGLGRHVGAVLGDEDVVGEFQEGEIGIGPVAVPDQAGQVGQTRGHGRLRRLGRAAREGQHQRATGGFHGPRDAVGQVGGVGPGQVKRPRPPPDQGRHARPGQGLQPVGEVCGPLSQPVGRHPVGRSRDRQHIGPDDAVMGRGDDEVIDVVAPAGVLGLDHEGLAARSGPRFRRQRQGGASGGDPEVRPGLAGRGFDGIGRRVQHPRRLQGRRQLVEGFAPADAFDDDAGRKKALDGFRQTQRLIFHAGPAVRDDPDRERGLVGPYFHSTLRIS